MIAAHDTQALADAAFLDWRSRRPHGGATARDELCFRDGYAGALASRLQEKEGQPAPTDEAIRRLFVEHGHIYAGWLELGRAILTLAAGSQAVQVPERIVELLEHHGSLRAAARFLECDVAYLWRLHSGEKTNPDDALLSRMGLRRLTTFERIES